MTDQKPVLIKGLLDEDAVWNIIYDILETVRLADKTGNAEVFAEVNDYVTNTYGE